MFNHKHMVNKEIWPRSKSLKYLLGEERINAGPRPRGGRSTILEKMLGVKK